MHLKALSGECRGYLKVITVPKQQSKVEREHQIRNEISRIENDQEPRGVCQRAAFF